MDQSFTYSAFLGTSLAASGNLPTVLSGIKPIFDQDRGASVLIFEDNSGRQVDFDLRGTISDVVARAMPEPPPEPPKVGPGRPKLGVIAREISLLPRHWEWLERQPTGASAAIRKLVDEARGKNEATDRARVAMEATNRFLSAMAGNLPGYEEATRALFARDRALFAERIQDWPADIRDYALRLAGDLG